MTLRMVLRGRGPKTPSSTGRPRGFWPVWFGIPGLVGSLSVFPAGSAPAPPDPGTQTVNVIVISFDPVLKTRKNLKLHEYMKWSDPWRLTEKMREDAKVASAGYVDYRVVERIEHDGFTRFRNGFTYTDDWLTYPTLPRQKKRLDAMSGGWDGIVRHHLWWMKRLPRHPGVTDGFYNNWWQYIVNYDEAIQKLPPPGATFLKAKRAMYAD